MSITRHEPEKFAVEAVAGGGGVDVGAGDTGTAVLVGAIGVLVGAGGVIVGAGVLEGRDVASTAGVLTDAESVGALATASLVAVATARGRSGDTDAERPKQAVAAPTPASTRMTRAAKPTPTDAKIVRMAY